MDKSNSYARKFPDSFLWGTATASHQVEGNNKNNDFWQWEKSSKSVPDSSSGTDQYNLYNIDFDLLKKTLHNNAYRFSLEWSRIQPSQDVFDEKSLEHYKKVLQSLKKRNIKTLVTLHHFTNPVWFSDLGGWEKSDNINYFEKYVEYCVNNFKEYVDYWIVINEPNVYAVMSHILGVWPPKVKKITTGVRVYLNLIKAHKIAYTKIHSIVPNAKVGSSINMIEFIGNKNIYKFFSKIAKFIYNKSFIHLSKNYWDFIGINYYYLHFINEEDFSDHYRVPTSQFINIFKGLRKDLLWPNYPKGIFNLTQEIWNKFGKEIIITESGIATSDDSIRRNFIMNTLTWLNRSIQKGAHISGYFYWSLTDNIEWGMGKKVRFGLFEMDYKTMKRIPRKSALFYSKICQSNSIHDYSLKTDNEN